MAYPSAASLLKVYRNFKALEPTAWLQIVRFYERNEEEIQQLDFDQYFDCLLTYSEALFQSGQSAKHLVMSDEVIRQIFQKNLTTWRGEDVFAQTLFRKAASHFNLDEISRAEHVLRELIKIRPYDKNPQKLLFRCFRKKKPSFLKKSRVLALLFFLVAVPGIAVDLFIVRPFFPIYERLAEFVWWSFFGLGWLALVIGDGWNYLHARRQVGQIVRAARLKKK